MPTNTAQPSRVARTPPLKKLQFSAGEWPPYLGANLPGQGIAAQLIRDIFADAGYQVSFHFLPWPRAYRETLHGQYAATAIWMYAPERAIDFYYSAAVLEEEFVLFHLKAQPILFDKLEDLAGVELGGGFGYSYGAAFDAAIANGVLKMTRVSQTRTKFSAPAKRPDPGFSGRKTGRIPYFAQSIAAVTTFVQPCGYSDPSQSKFCVISKTKPGQSVAAANFSARATAISEFWSLSALF